MSCSITVGLVRYTEEIQEKEEEMYGVKQKKENCGQEEKSYFV